jgi:hypothetical protein
VARSGDLVAGGDRGQRQALSCRLDERRCPFAIMVLQITDSPGASSALRAVKFDERA